MQTPKITADRIREYLSSGKRFDGRGLGEFRDIVIETPVSVKAEGSARVRIGKTEVIVGIKMDVSEPYPDSPNKGNLMVTGELLPLSSSRFESGPPKFPAIELGRLVDRGIRESGFIDFEKLCIEEGKKVWTVFVDVYSINDDGNILDAAAIGALVALKNAKIPRYDEESGKAVYGELTDVSIPVSEEVPIVTTVYKIGDSLVVDPTLEEQDVCETKVTIGGTAEGKIFSMQKGDSKELSIDEMAKVLELSKESKKEVLSKIEEYMK